MTTRDDHIHFVKMPYDIWLARGAIVVIAVLQWYLINDFSIGPRWLLPAFELLLLVPLSVATVWTIDKAKNATDKHHFIELAKYRHAIRIAAIILTAFVTLANFAALFDLIRALLSGKAGAAPSLLLDAINIWITNVIAFALWFWNMDRGGPVLRGLHTSKKEDFQFPNMTSGKTKDWYPGFIDYLFLAFTNATAFSPTDTLPLSQRAKLLMMAQAAVSLLVVTLVAARAVNILS